MHLDGSTYHVPEAHLEWTDGPHVPPAPMRPCLGALPELAGQPRLRELVVGLPPDDSEDASHADPDYSGGPEGCGAFFDTFLLSDRKRQACPACGQGGIERHHRLTGRNMRPPLIRKLSTQKRDQPLTKRGTRSAHPEISRSRSEAPVVLGTKHH